MSGQNRKMVIAYKQFLSTWCHPNERKVLGNVLLLYTGCLQHVTNKAQWSWPCRAPPLQCTLLAVPILPLLREFGTKYNNDTMEFSGDGMNNPLIGPNNKLLTFDTNMLQKSVIPFWKWQSKPSNIGQTAGRSGGSRGGGPVSLVPQNKGLKRVLLLWPRWKMENHDHLTESMS